MRLVVALGGNALLGRGEHPTVATQRANLAIAAAGLVALAQRHQLVVTHGNGPQIGLLALRAASSDAVPADPLDVLGAESEGMIGYLIEQELASRLPGRAVASLLTMVEVDPGDAAFEAPTKPIGPRCDAATAQRWSAAFGWTMVEDGAGFRRVVPSPEPRRILEAATLALLVRAGVLVVCVGGGGVPVAVAPDGAIRGIEAVIDKDLAAARLAVELDAEALVMLTDVPAVLADWPSPAAQPIRRAAAAALRARRFAAGSMGPKVEAACRFAEATGNPAFIGALGDAEAILAERCGTRIDRG